VVMTIQDGTYCAAINGAPTTGIFVFTCGAAGTASRITNVNQAETCHYFVYITTPYACGGPAPSSSSSSSSSSTAARISAPTSPPTSNPAGAQRSSSSSTAASNSQGGVTSSSSANPPSIVPSSSANGGGAVSSSNSGNSGLTHGQLAGAIIGPILAFLLCCLIFCCLFVRRGKGWKKHQDTGGRHDEQHTAAASASTEPSYADGEHSEETGDEVEMA